MFNQLMPLLAERTVLVTVARETDNTIRATVVLDREFAKELAAYVDVHRQLGSTFAQAKATMEAAAKAAQEEAKRKADERRKAKSSNPAVSGGGDGSIVAGPEGARPPSLDGGVPGNRGGPLISEFGFEVK